MTCKMPNETLIYDQKLLDLSSSYSYKGKRSTQEDRLDIDENRQIIINLVEPTTKKELNVSFYLMIDGHGGELVAEYLKNHFLDRIKVCLSTCLIKFFVERKTKLSDFSLDLRNQPKLLQRIDEDIKQEFVKFDKEVFDYLYYEVGQDRKYVGTNERDFLVLQGACVNLLVKISSIEHPETFASSSSAAEVLVLNFNLGDCRCYLNILHQGIECPKPIFVSYDHNCTNPKELEKLKNVHFTNTITSILIV